VESVRLSGVCCWWGPASRWRNNTLSVSTLSISIELIYIPAMDDSPDIEHFRARLLELREQIASLNEVRDESSATVTLDQSRVGRLSRMDAMQQQAMARSSRERAQQELKRIAAALRRCDDGSYGYCLECDEPIARKRLEIDPAAPYCIQCAEARQ